MQIALVQKSPAFLDRSLGIEITVQSIREAAHGGAGLVVFPETFIGGYPAWLWQLRPGPDSALAEALHVRLNAACVDLASDQLGPVREAARQHAVTVVLGLNEAPHEAPRGTFYNTVVIIDANGEVANRHRKIMPTNPERMAWGFGDASGMRVVPTAAGRVGSLICWENMHPLARASLYAQGVELYVAPTYDHGPRWLASMQHIAREGGCWVLSCSSAFQARDLLQAAPELAAVYPDPDAWVNPGDSCLVTPGGRIVGAPLHEAHGIVRGQVDLARIAAAKRTFDCAGHYARPDLFHLAVDRAPQQP